MRIETASAIELSLPYLFAPRSYQWRVYEAWDAGIRRFGAVWHRRNGKDTTFLNFCIERMLDRTGNYFHVFPKLNQGRRVIWDGINRTGQRVLDHFPPDLIYGTPNKADMQITLVNPADARKPGSTYQILGTDRNLDVLVGSNPVGVIFSEYALQNPHAWDLCRPILRENGGWAAFCYTPRGKNHGYTLFTTNRNNPDWYFELLDVTQTFRDGPDEDGSPVISPADIEADKREGMSQDLIDQEYYLSWEAAIPGAYYANEFRAVDAERRITRVPYDPSYPVYTFWDIGIDDATAIWCVQFIGRQICLLHYCEDSGHGADFYARYLASLPYQGNYRAHILPHDGHVREWGSGETRKQVLERLVQGVVETATRPVDVTASINNVRTIFPRLLFDDVGCGPREEKMQGGIEALRSYHHKWDEQAKVFANYPDHDWCLTGDTKVLTRYGMYQIMDLPKTGEVLTSCGWKVYENPRITRRNAPLVEVVFSDGYTVRCTPEHLFKTVNGWKSAKSLQRGLVIQSSLTPLRSISMGGSTAFGQARAIIRAVGESSIGLFGKQRLGRFVHSAISTTKTIILPIMPLTTWNASLVVSICPSRGARGKPISCQEPISLSMPVSKRLRGMPLRKGACGIAVTPAAPSHGRSGTEKTVPVCSAGRRFPVLSAIMDIVKNIVRRPAKLLSIAVVVSLPTREDTWCLTVPGIEEFSLANGALVHNSSHGADALRTLAVSLTLVQRIEDRFQGQPLPSPAAAHEFTLGRASSTAWMG